MSGVPSLVVAVAVATLVATGVAGGYVYGSRHAIAVASCTSLEPALAPRDDSAMRHFSEAPAAPVQGKRW